MALAQISTGGMARPLGEVQVGTPERPPPPIASIYMGGRKVLSNVTLPSHSLTSPYLPIPALPTGRPMGTGRTSAGTAAGWGMAAGDPHQGPAPLPDSLQRMAAEWHCSRGEQCRQEKCESDCECDCEKVRKNQGNQKPLETPDGRNLSFGRNNWQRLSPSPGGNNWKGVGSTSSNES